MVQQFFKKMFRKIFIVLFIFSLSQELLADDKMELGLKVYNNTGMCGTCHTLEEAKSKGEIGPNLDFLKPKIEKIVYTVTNGVGVMPMFEGILTSE